MLLITSITLSAQSIERWGCFELSLSASTKGNPFDVQLKATFTNGGEKIEVSGFYDGSDTYRIRFMPPSEGTWSYTTSSKVAALNRKKGSFECISAGEGNHGPVRAEGLGFKYADGTPYYPVGTTSYDWMHVPGEKPSQTIASLKESGFNKLRCLFFLHNLPIEYPDIAPFEKNSDGSWDYSRFNPSYFQYVEDRILALQSIGVEADLILFHPYDGGRWGFDRMPLEVNLRYLSYITARLSAFRNVWWSLANEFDGLRAIPLEDWGKFAQRVYESDPYRHLLSIHGYTATYYDYWLPVFTHASIQDHAPVMESGRAFTLLKIFRKPVILDEVCYEGNAGARWGELSGEEMLRRIYNGLMSGAYVTHAECFNLTGESGGKEDMTNYLAFGGEFHGESWKRIAFLRSLLADLPGPLGLADSSWDPHTTTAGKGYYLIYLGKEMPERWDFNLPTRNWMNPRLGEGAKFKVEVIDTWNMSITECPTVFETERLDGYRVIDKNHSYVKLPQRPYLLLRIKAIE